MSNEGNYFKLVEIIKALEKQHKHNVEEHSVSIGDLLLQWEAGKIDGLKMALKLLIEEGE